MNNIKVIEKILGYGVFKIEKAEWSNHVLIISSNTFQKEQISTFEIAHKGKKWALKHNFVITSGFTRFGGFCELSIMDIDIDKEYSIKALHRGKTEEDAILECCKWILDNYVNK